jgi:hypothetical protein
LEKYGHNVDVIGHSQGAKIAELASRGDKRVKDVITYNRPVGLKESLTPLDKNVVDIRSSYDPVSMFAPLQRNNKPIVLKNESWNPLQQHNSSSLAENPNFDIGEFQGEGFMINNKEILTPDEQKSLEYKKYFQAHTQYQREQERLEKEKQRNFKIVKKATKTRILKGTQEMKDKMAALRAKKKK